MSCNCACMVCMSGRCCMAPPPMFPEGGWRYTPPQTTFSVGCGDDSHAFAKFDPARIFCTRCGTFRAVVKEAKP